MVPSCNGSVTSCVASEVMHRHSPAPMQMQYTATCLRLAQVQLPTRRADMESWLRVHAPSLWTDPQLGRLKRRWFKLWPYAKYPQRPAATKLSYGLLLDTCLVIFAQSLPAAGPTEASATDLKCQWPGPATDAASLHAGCTEPAVPWSACGLCVSCWLRAIAKVVDGVH